MQMKFLSIIVAGTLMFSGSIFAQDDQSVQTYTAGRLLAKGKRDLTLFNSLYTESETNWMGNKFEGYRTTFSTNLLQMTWGVSENGRFNLGFDASFRNSGTVSTSDDYSGIGEAFKFQNTATSRVGLTNVGVRVRWQPFKSEENFTLQSTLSGPVIQHPEGNNELYWADWNRITSWTQFFFVKDFDNSQLFLEADLLYRFPLLSSQIGHMDLPTTVIYSYFLNDKWTMYGIGQHMTRLSNHYAPQDPDITDFVIPASYTLAGAGMKYAFSKQFQLELLYSKFIRAVNSGKGESYNLGIRYLF